MKLLHAGMLLASLLLSACGESSQTFVVDNPTSAPISIDIDGQAQTIPANASTPLKLAPGAHTLHSKQLGDVRFIVYARGNGGLLNPTLSDYVIANQVYVTDESKLRNFGAFQNRITLDEVEFTGPFRQSHDLFIPQAWDFGVREPFPETQVAHVPENGGNIYSKIFSAADFISYYEDEYDQTGYFAQQRPGGFTQPRHTLKPAPATLPPLVPEYEAHAGPLRALYTRHLQTTDPKEQLKLQKEDFNAVMAYVAATSRLGADLGSEANQQQNDFMTLRTNLMGSPALVTP